jgi:hypothetical protein
VDYEVRGLQVDYEVRGLQVAGATVFSISWFFMANPFRWVPLWLSFEGVIRRANSLSSSGKDVD